MKTKTGTFGVDTQASNSLVANLLKYPEISSTLIEQYPRYALTYLLEKTGRHANVKIAGDKSFEWKVLGRQSQPLVVSPSFAGTGTGAGTATALTVPFTNNYLALNDLIIDAAGNVGQVTAVDGATGDVTRPSNTKVVDSRDAGYNYVVNFSSGNLAIVGGSVFGKIGSAFGEGSLGADVSEHTAYPDTYKNWLTINRNKMSINGSALTDVTWIENNGSKLWYFTAEKLFTDEFMYQLELQRWFGRTNMVDTDADDYPGHSTDPLAVKGNLRGDGILAQIEGTITSSYAPLGGLTEDKLARFIAELSRNAKSPEGNEWVVFTGTEGRYQFHKAMKDISVGATAATGGTMQSMKTGSDVSLGVNYVSYNVLGNKLTVAYCPVFEDVNAHSTSSSIRSTSSISTMSINIIKYRTVSNS
jgi:hypothetical protein